MSGTASLLDRHDGLLLDLDGVVYVGPRAVPGAVAALGTAAGRVPLAYVTNNASRPPAAVAEHLRELGIDATDEQVVTSAQVAAAMVLRRFGPGARVLAVGGPGVALALEAAGLVPVTGADDDPQAVVQGYGTGVGWADLAEATFAVRAGAWWVATNRDLTVPTDRGIAPGNGTLVAAVRTASGVEPVVAGKPEPVAFTEAAARLGSSRPLVVGDRIDTDVEGAVAAGMDALLVLTGVHGLDDLVRLDPRSRPRYVAADLDGLHRPPLEVAVEGDLARCGEEEARLVDGTVQVRAGADPLAAGWAGVALLWAAADAGRDAVPGDGLAQALRWRPAASQDDR